MAGIDRYDPITVYEGAGEYTASVEKRDDGDFVLHDDHVESVASALAADRARIAQAIREELRKHNVLRRMGFKTARALTYNLLHVVEGA